LTERWQQEIKKLRRKKNSQLHPYQLAAAGSCINNHQQQQQQSSAATDIVSLFESLLSLAELDATRGVPNNDHDHDHII
jgi:hypothetical protein